VTPVLQSFACEVLFRGIGAATVKSFELSLVSRQPPDFLKDALVLLCAAALFVPSKQSALP